MGKSNSPFFHIFFSTIKTFLISITIVILILYSGCGDSIVEPEPGSRDYEWSYETLDLTGTQNSEPNCMWGSAANDVWIAAPDMGKILLWHYDGKSWQREEINPGGYPVKLWGTSPDNIWLLDMSGSIWKYDGVHWNAYSDIALPDEFNYLSFYDMYGNSSDDIYFAGAADKDRDGNGDYKGVVVLYKNGKWSYMNIPEEEIRFISIHKQKSTGSYFVSGYYFEAEGHKSKIYKYDGKSSLTAISTGHGLAELNGEVYFEGNQKLYTYNHGSLVLRKNFTGTEYMGGMTGRSENDFFCYDKYFNILHYNGTNFKKIYDDNMMMLGNGQVFEKDVFFALKKKGDIVVLHGKLK